MADDLGLLARATAGVDGNCCAGNLLKAGEWLRARSWDFDSTTDAITYLEHLTLHVEAQGTTALSGDRSVVRVMNLHKVKGLEAPVVFLANTKGATKPIPPDRHIDRSDTGAKGYFFAKTVGQGFRSKRVEIARLSDWTKSARGGTFLRC